MTTAQHRSAMLVMPRALGPGARVRVHCVGSISEGVVTAVRAGWIELLGPDGASFIAVAQVGRIDVLAPAAPGEQVSDDGISVPRPAPMGGRISAPARPWNDSELKHVAQGFLDNRADGELAAQFGRSRHQITVLHQAFDAARGERVAEDCSPAARTWIERLRRVLAG